MAGPIKATVEIDVTAVRLVQVATLRGAAKEIRASAARSRKKGLKHLADGQRMAALQIELVAEELAGPGAGAGLGK